MHVGLDGLPLSSSRTGVGHYTFELARALAALAPADTFELVGYKPFSPAAVHEIKKGPPNLHSQIARRYHKWWAIGLPRYIRTAHMDLFHGTNYDVPLWNKHRNVLTIHDLSVLLYPDKHDAKVVRRARRRLPIMTRSASQIITVSEYIKQEVIEHLGIPAEKILVTPGAPRESFQPLQAKQTTATKQRLKIEDDFILFVGTLEPRKNLLTLVRAFDDLIRHTVHRPQLVIAGGEGWLMDEFTSVINNPAISDRVRLPGYLSDEDLRALYSSCKVFVYPSIYEGFGLPPLEAMACGAPVIASAIPVFRETLGSAAQLIDPHDYKDLALAIVQILEDEPRRQSMVSAGRRHVQKFSWEITARLTLNAYRDVLAKSTGQ